LDNRYRLCVHCCVISSAIGTPIERTIFQMAFFVAQLFAIFAKGKMNNRKPHKERKSLRASWHDYNGGKYFVTICTKNREHFFGEIIDGKMRMSGIGAWADEQLRNVASHYTYAEIPLWVIMPNHIHAIIIIDENKIPHEKRIVGAFRSAVGAFHETPLQQRSAIQYATQMQSWLSVVVRQFKQSVTRFANENNIHFAWQTRYHDHIIRDVNELNRIAEYIENNVARWDLDVNKT